MRGMKRTLALMTVICMCLLSLEIPVSAKDSKQEPIKVGFFQLNGFYGYDQYGQPTGYGVEYLDNISDQGGWEYEFVRADNWQSALEMLEEGKIDMLAPAQLTGERAGQFLYDAFPIGTEYGSLLALSTNVRVIYEDFEAFSDMKIGSVSSVVFMDAFMSYAQEHEFTPHFIYYKDTAALTAALNAGEVDAILANLMVKTDTMKVLGKFGAAPIYFLINPGRPDVAEMINKSIQEYSVQYPNFKNELTEKYFPHYVQNPFTKAEFSYIESLSPLVVGIPADFAPISYEDENGEPQGIDKNILEEISKVSGLKFEYKMLPTVDVSYKYLTENQIKIVPNVEFNSKHAHEPRIMLTSPYLSMSKVFVGKKSVSYDLEGPMKVAVASAAPNMYEVLAAEYPNFQMIRFETTEQCFDAVMEGEADLVLQNRYVVEILLHSPYYSKLMVLPTEALNSKFCFSVITDYKSEDVVQADERLVSILDKSISQISDTEIEKYVSQGVSQSVYKFGVRDFFYQYRGPVAIVTLVVLVGGAALIYSYMTSRKSGRIVRENERKLRNITNNINGGVVVLRAEEGLEITFANDGFLELIQCSREEFENLYGCSYVACVHPEDLTAIDKLIQKDVPEGEQISVQMRIKRKDEEYIQAMFNGTMSQKEDGKKEMYCVIMDVSMQARIMENLVIEKKRTDIIMEKSDEIIYEADLSNKEIYVSRSLEEKFGWTISSDGITDDFRKNSFMKHIVEEDRKKMEDMTQEILEHHRDVQCTVRLLKNGIEPVWCEISQYPVLNETGRLVAIVGRILDVDAETKERKRLEAKSQKDLLTGLYNKEAFANKVKQCLKSKTEGSGALLFIDLDHFKNVNDTLGHLAGDEAIKDAAKKLQIIFSNYDILSRFGGDEFCVYVKDIPVDTLKDKLDWLLEKLNVTYRREDKNVQISGSVGVACTEDAGLDYEQLADCADKALYASKENGRNRYTFYNRD